MPRRILIAEPLDFSPQAVSLLSQAADVELRQCDRDGLAQALADFDVVWFRLAHRFDRQLLARATRCRILATPVTGLDHIDLGACQEHGIRVVSLRGEVEFLRTVRATAELTVGLTLALLRQIPPAAASVADGVWDRDRFRGQELYGKTIGLVGVGRLGSLVAGFFRVFGAEVLGYDPRSDFPTDVCTRVGTLSELFRRSDIVSIHAIYKAQTRHLIGREQLAAMPAGAILVNTARGGIVDETALLDALSRGQLAGAALDVLDGEPDITARHPVVAYAQRHSNVLIVPHIGGNTRESFEKTECFLAGRVVEALADLDRPGGEVMLVPVNFHYIRPKFDDPYPGIHGISPEKFAAQLKLLGQFGTFVSAAELRAAVGGKRLVAARALIVTLDDGLREQFDYAWPILRELKIPAIFFINTLPIATGTIAAVHQIHLVRANLAPEEFESRLRHKAAERGLTLSGETDLAAATKHYIYDTTAAAQLKYLLNFSLRPAMRDQIVAEIFDEIFPGREMAMSRKLYMSPEQIAELGRHEAIGSHSHDHLPLGLLARDEIEAQISLAAHYLTDWAGYAPYALSYPYGSRDASSLAAAEIARRHGVEFAFTTERAANFDLSRPLHLARFDNNDLPGGKAARFQIDQLPAALTDSTWWEQPKS